MKTADTYAPSFYDKKVYEINRDLNWLGWIEHIHPVADVGVDEEGTFPEVYMNDGTKKSIRILPSGNSLSFFEVNEIDQIDETEFFGVNLSIVVWADLTKVYPSKTYNYRSELIKDIKGVLDGHSAYDMSVQVKDVFSEYSQLEKINNQNTMLPYTAFRITFTVNLLTC